LDFNPKLEEPPHQQQTARNEKTVTNMASRRQVEQTDYDKYCKFPRDSGFSVSSFGDKKMAWVPDKEQGFVPGEILSSAGGVTVVRSEKGEVNCPLPSFFSILRTNSFFFFFFSYELIGAQAQGEPSSPNESTQVRWC